MCPFEDFTWMRDATYQKSTTKTVFPDDTLNFPSGCLTRGFLICFGNSSAAVKKALLMVTKSVKINKYPAA